MSYVKRTFYLLKILSAVDAGYGSVCTGKLILLAICCSFSFVCMWLKLSIKLR